VSLVNYTFTYVGASDTATDSREKVISNLNFTFQGNTFTRSGLSFTTYPTTSSVALTATGVTGTGAFAVTRDVCRNTSGSGTPLLNKIALRILKNSVEVYNVTTNLADPTVPTCSTQTTNTQTSSSITVAAGDNIEVIFTDVFCVSGLCF